MQQQQKKPEKKYQKLFWSTKLLVAEREENFWESFNTPSVRDYMK